MNDVTPTPTERKNESGSVPPSRSVALSHWGPRLGTLVRKELAETLRDRRTIVTLVLMPLLVYPLLSVGFRQWLLLQGTSLGSSQPRIVAANNQELELLRDWLAKGEMAISGEFPEVSFTATEMTQKSEESPLKDLKWFTDKEPLIALRRRQADIAFQIVDLGPPNDLPGARPLRVDIVMNDDSDLSASIRDAMERRIRAANLLYLRNRLQELQQPAFVPMAIRRMTVETPKRQRSLLPTLIPLVLLLMTITGAVYPAIDLTAGERERNTLESLVAAPVPRLHLLLAKYFAVLTVALLTAVVNLFGMTVTLFASGLGATVFGPAGIGLSTIFLVLGLLVLFAAFFAAVLLAITSHARSFKEAQAYLIPVMMLALAPGLFSLTPDLRLAGVISVTPLVNIVLLARDMLSGSFPVVGACATLVSTVLYAVASLAIAARIFGSDAILYGSQGSWSDLFRNGRAKAIFPEFSNALVCLGIVFALQITVFGLVGAFVPFVESPISYLTVAAMVLLLVFIGVPYFATKLERVQPASAFRLAFPGIPSLFAAVLLGLSMWAVAFEGVVLAKELDFVSLSEKLIPELYERLNQFRAVPLPVLIMCLGVVPAIAEETFFRGYLLGAMETKLGPWKSVIGNGVVFALFHLFTQGTLTPERLIPSFLLGCVFSFLAIRSQSLVPSMIMHAVSNSLVVTISHHPELLSGLGIESTTNHLPGWLLTTCGVMALVGLAIGSLKLRGRVTESALPPMSGPSSLANK